MVLYNINKALTLYNFIPYNINIVQGTTVLDFAV